MSLSWSKRTDGEYIVWICYVVGHKVNTKITILCGMTPCSFVGTCFPHVQVQSLSTCQVGAYHYTKNVREVRSKSSQRYMQLIHCIFIFNTIFQHTDAFVPSWHEFKNSDTVEIGILHSQPLTATSPSSFPRNRQPPSQALPQRPKPMTILRFPQSVPQLRP